jgi:two-component system KDP operon response regulator KdpE
MTGNTHPAVLIIDDEDQIRRAVRLTLESAKFRVLEAPTAATGLAAVAADDRPDGVILDLGLPDMDGTAVLRRIRQWSKIPILVLTVRRSEEDIIGALDAGADDYLTKPFGGRELVARLRAVLRRAQPVPESALVAFGDVELDRSARVVRRAGAEVKLTGKEYGFLLLLAENRGRIITHRELLRSLWGPQSEESTHYLRVQMAHLRKKLEAEPHKPRYLVTAEGIGYRLLDS